MLMDQFIDRFKIDYWYGYIQLSSQETLE